MLGAFSGTPFATRISNYEKNALSGNKGKYDTCSKDMAPLVEAFFKKVSKAHVEWSSENPIAVNLEVLTQIVEQLAYNTHSDEVIEGNDMQNIQNIFKEFDILYKELLDSQRHESYDISSISGRLDCIYEIIAKNHALNHGLSRKSIHNGKLFQSYENLWKAIHAINSRWSRLVKAGFSTTVFLDFYEVFCYERKNSQEKSEQEKLDLFMGILDGSKRFAPVYEQKAVAFQIIPVGVSKCTINPIDTRFSRGYKLLPNKDKKEDADS